MEKHPFLLGFFCLFLGGVTSASNCTGELLTWRGRGPEGWSPLLNLIADDSKASNVRNIMMDTNEFYMPKVSMPTAAKSNPAYGPNIYWRGRVWLDQFQMGTRALGNYGYDSDAEEFIDQLLDNAQGLTGPDRITENYNPETGETQGAANFGWSAAHLLMMMWQFKSQVNENATPPVPGMPELAEKYGSRLDRTGVPQYMLDYDEYNNQVVNPLMDCGAWHGVTIADAPGGGWGGPMMVAEDYSVFLVQYVEQMTLEFDGTDTLVVPTDSSSIPGKLRQECSGAFYEVEMETRTVTNRISLHRTILKITGTGDLKLKLRGRHITEFDADQSLEEKYPGFHRTVAWDDSIGEISIQFSEVRSTSDLMLSGESQLIIRRDFPATAISMVSTSNDDGYETEVDFNTVTDIELEYWTTIGYFHDLVDMGLYYDDMAGILIDPQTYWDRSVDQWEGYLYGAVEKYTFDETRHVEVAVKSVETLLGNWRSAAGSLLHDGTTPAVTEKWFNGVWAWDSWKHAAAMAHFAPEVAKDNMRCLFDHQITATDSVRPQDDGFIIDCVFYNQDFERGGDGARWNERNTKPPLASWALSEIYAATGDKSYLQEMLPKIVKYHEWWFNNRDANSNGIPEYGGTVHRRHNDADGNILFCLQGAVDELKEALGDTCSLTEGTCVEDQDADCSGTDCWMTCYTMDSYNLALDHGGYQDIDIPVQDGAGWESGMDDAARFGFISDDQLDAYANEHHAGDLQAARNDWNPRFMEVKDGKGNVVGFTIDQESVDLISYLYQEKVLLKRLLDEAGMDPGNHDWDAEAEFLKDYVNDCMFDQTTKFFYDRSVPIPETESAGARVSVIAGAVALIMGVFAF